MIAAGLPLVFLLVASIDAGGQELPLKREVPGSDSVACPEYPPPTQPTQEEVAQAIRLASDADQALILGNRERARDLLARALELNPTSAELAYRYARVLEALGLVEPAIEQFCRVIALEAGREGIGDARTRMEALARSREPEIPLQARETFLTGLRSADLGDLPRAEEAFSWAFLAVPDWADAVYNRGVIRIRMGLRDQAVADLQRYLELAPEAPDAIQVSQRIGQLQIRPTPSVRPGAAFGLGLLIPGMGQFYSGRALGGFSVLALAGGAAAAGFLIEKEEVRCVGSIPSGGECPPERIISTEKTNPYLMHGLASAGVIAVVGAVEAYLKARSLGEGGDGNLAALDGGTVRVAWPSLSSRGRGLQLNLLKVTF